MAQANVITLHHPSAPLDDDEALVRLSKRVDGRVELSLSELCQEFGWSRDRLRRRLVVWHKAGRITRAASAKGMVTLLPAGDRATPARSPTPDQPMSRQAVARIVERALGSGAPPVHPPVQKPPRSIMALVTAAVLFATALGLTGVGLVMNARFAASFGQTVEAAVLLAAIGLAIDLLAVVLPSVAMQLWHRRSILAAGAAWTIWLGALTMTLLAAAGFASTNIGDAVAGRAKIAGERSVLAERIDRLRLERAGITETRSVAAIEVELQRAQPEAQAVWKITAGCRDVTRVTSGRACATVLELREAQATAERRDLIDAELREAQSKLAGLPAVVAADPQATTVAEIVAWVSAGAFSPAPADVSRLRYLGLALMPSLAGLVGMLALSLAQARRT